MGRIKRATRKKVFDRDGNRCLKCGAAENLTVDHITSIAQGGTDEITNLQTLCYPCNLKKGSKVHFSLDYRDNKSDRAKAAIVRFCKPVKKKIFKRKWF